MTGFLAWWVSQQSGYRRLFVRDALTSREELFNLLRRTYAAGVAEGEVLSKVQRETIDLQARQIAELEQTIKNKEWARKVLIEQRDGLQDELRRLRQQSIKP
jgi:hypothetical protein